MSVRTRLKVLVSCMKRAASTRLAIGECLSEMNYCALSWPERDRAVDAPYHSAAWGLLCVGPRAIIGAQPGGLTMPDTLASDSWETMACTPDSGPAATAAIGLITLSNDVVIEPEL